MRFYLFDRVIGFDSGREATAIKNVASQEEFLIDHYERLPVMPSPLIVESIAQLGGWIVTVSTDYRYLAVMVMAKNIEISGDAVPGDQIVVHVRLEELNDYGARISSVAMVDGRPVVSVGLITYVLYEIPPAEREQVKSQYNRLRA
jgi:3-hydroxyacyl-[acyl-carrier-protein] dehydratase